eukprot:scaffold3415_cov368-Prasinococcus_capsulatus_cf.AAC.4
MMTPGGIPATTPPMSYKRARSIQTKKPITICRPAQHASESLRSARNITCPCQKASEICLLPLALFLCQSQAMPSRATAVQPNGSSASWEGLHSCVVRAWPYLSAPASTVNIHSRPRMRRIGNLPALAISTPASMASSMDAMPTSSQSVGLFSHRLREFGAPICCLPSSGVSIVRSGFWAVLDPPLGDAGALPFLCSSSVAVRSLRLLPKDSQLKNDRLLPVLVAAALPAFNVSFAPAWYPGIEVLCTGEADSAGGLLVSNIGLSMKGMVPSGGRAPRPFDPRQGSCKEPCPAL